MNNFEQEYKNAMNDVHASEDLRNRIMNIKPQKRTVTPLRTTLLSVAAAVAIMVVAHDYDFTPDTSGVINEAVVSTQVPQRENHAVAEVTETPVIAKVTPKPQVRPQKVEEPVVVAEAEPQALNDEEPEGVPMTVRNVGDENSIAETWEINKYFEYIGGNPQDKISAVVPMEYTGDETLEFLVDSEGELVSDMVTLDYASADKCLSVTVSKKPMFDGSISGTVNATDNGFIAYKVSGDVYYYIFANGVSQDEITAIVNNF